MSPTAAVSSAWANCTSRRSAVFLSTFNHELRKSGILDSEPAKGFKYLYTHLPSGSLVVSAANEKDKPLHTSLTPKNKEAKRLDLFGRKIYSTASLQFWVADHQALLESYNFNLWDTLLKFQESLPQGLA